MFKFVDYRVNIEMFIALAKLLDKTVIEIYDEEKQHILILLECTMVTQHYGIPRAIYDDVMHDPERLARYESCSKDVYCNDFLHGAAEKIAALIPEIDTSEQLEILDKIIYSHLADDMINPEHPLSKATVEELQAELNKR